MDKRTGYDAQRAVTIAVLNHKGGSAKTTTVVNLGGVFAAEMGLRVLAVDVDSQANCTMGLGFDPYQLSAKKRILISDVLRPSDAGGHDTAASLRDAILVTEIPNLDLAPSSLELSRMEIALINSMKREEKLNQILQPVRRDYDLILIDCPPSLGIFTTNALFAADFVLIPVEAANYAVAGLTAIIDIVNGVRRNGQDVNILGIFNTRVAATNAAREAMENTKRLFSTSYIDIPIQVSTASENAVREGRPLVISDPKHKLSQAYREIAHEVLRRAGLEDRVKAKAARPGPTGGKAALVLEKMGNE
jgi:chromosome partitioning protein